MRATIVFSGAEGQAAAVLMAGEPGMPAGLVSFSLRVGDRLEAVFMPPQVAALLAGEIERAAWAAQRVEQARRDRCIPSGLGQELMAAAVTAQALEDAGHLGMDL